MATQGTLTVTFDDGSNISAEEAGRFILDLAAMVRERYKGNSNVTTITNTLSSKTITMAIA